MEGYLWKRSDFLKNWNKRYCRLNNTTFSYYASHTIPLNDPIRIFTLENALIAPSDNEFARPFTFLFRTKEGSTLYFSAENEASFLSWLETLSIHITSFNQQLLYKTSSASSSSSKSIGASSASASASSISNDSSAFANRGSSSTSSSLKAPPPDASDPLSFLLQEQEEDGTRAGARDAAKRSDHAKESSPKKSNPVQRRKMEASVPKKPLDVNSIQSKPSPFATLDKFHFTTDAVSASTITSSNDLLAKPSNLVNVEISGNAMRDAIKENDFNLVKRLVEESSKLGVDLVTCKDSQGETMLHIASVLGRNDIALFLVNHGADPTLLNKYNESCFDVAAPVLAMQMKKAFYEGEETKVNKA